MKKIVFVLVFVLLFNLSKTSVFAENPTNSPDFEIKLSDPPSRGSVTLTPKNIPSAWYWNMKIYWGDGFIPRNADGSPNPCFNVGAAQCEYPGTKLHTYNDPGTKTYTVYMCVLNSFFGVNDKTLVSHEITIPASTPTPTPTPTFTPIPTSTYTPTPTVSPSPIPSSYPSPTPSYHY